MAEEKESRTSKDILTGLFGRVLVTQLTRNGIDLDKLIQDAKRTTVPNIDHRDLPVIVGMWGENFGIVLDDLLIMTGNSPITLQAYILLRCVISSDDPRLTHAVELLFPGLTTFFDTIPDKSAQTFLTTMDALVVEYCPSINPVMWPNVWVFMKDKGDVLLQFLQELQVGDLFVLYSSCLAVEAHVLLMCIVHVLYQKGDRQMINEFATAIWDSEHPFCGLIAWADAVGELPPQMPDSGLIASTAMGVTYVLTRGKRIRRGDLPRNACIQAASQMEFFSRGAGTKVGPNEYFCSSCGARSGVKGARAHGHCGLPHNCGLWYCSKTCSTHGWIVHGHKTRTARAEKLERKRNKKLAKKLAREKKEENDGGE